MRIIYLILILFTYNTFSSDEVEINTDDIWALDVRSNKFFRNGEVLFQMPQDALHTFRGREYGDWNEFSFIDSRRLIKLKKGDRIKIVESYFNSDVFKVILLDGFYKNKTYYTHPKKFYFYNLFLKITQLTNKRSNKELKF